MGLRLSALRLALAALIAIAGGWLVVVTGASNVLERVQPQRALAFAPFDARANGALAELALANGGEPSRASAARAAGLARRALARDITIVPAWRTLGLAEGFEERGRHSVPFIKAAEWLSRRDLPTELWIIEQQVQQGNVAGALAHYDVALRTSPSSYDTLNPILATAAGDPNTGPAVGRLLAKRPGWAGNFYYHLAQTPPADALTLARTLEIAGRGGPLSNADALNGLVAKLVERGAYGPALRVAAVLDRTPARLSKAVRNGGFEQPLGIAPFDWSLATGDGYGAEIQAGLGSGGQALAITAASAADGQPARQLMLLPAGRYSLRYRAGGTGRALPDRLDWQLTCATGAAIGQAAIQPGAGGRAGAMAFVVPAGCPAQWLALHVAADNPEGSEAWVDDVEVRRVEG